MLENVRFEVISSEETKVLDKSGDFFIVTIEYSDGEEIMFYRGKDLNEAEKVYKNV